VAKGARQHGVEDFAARRAGRKPKRDATDLRIDTLKKRNARLEAQFALARKLLDLQKKPRRSLGVDLPTPPKEI
jgi:hypothetical protein